MEAALATCLLTDEEMEGGEASWRALADPFAEAWEREAGGHSHEHDHGGEHGGHEGGSCEAGQCMHEHEAQVAT